MITIVPYVYGLADPDTDEIRYVGKSTRHPATTLGRHVADAVHGVHAQPKGEWIAGIIERGAVPRVVVLEEVELEALNQAEVRWIAHFGLENLTNVHAGGAGGAKGQRRVPAGLKEYGR